MINFICCKVDEILEVYEDITKVKVNISGTSFNAINYNYLTGAIKMGDNVKVNTTAVDLDLGTGGYHFVISNDSIGSNFSKDKGHIMKLRYTPYQLKCYTPEEDEENRSIFDDFQGMDNLPVLVGTLHSMLGPVAATIKYFRPSAKIAYIMTDGGALPLAISDNVRKLKMLKLLDCTITYGHAFGGDYEAVNVYSSLIISKEIAKCDVVIVAMGPGIVGTGTKYGFSGIEQGTVVDAVTTLGGKAIAIPRISFKDIRDRHRGISHHSITIMDKIIKTRAIIPIPNLEEDKDKHIIYQLSKLSNLDRYEIVRESGDEIGNILSFFNLDVTTMGRSLKEDPDFFQALCACGKVALEYL